MAKKRRGRVNLNNVLMAGLGGLAMGAAAYAADGLELGNVATGLIKLGTGLVVGTGVAMVNPALGAGLTGGGVGLGVYTLGGEALASLAKPASAETKKTEKKVASIRANLNAVQGRTALPQGRRGSGLDISQQSRATGNLRAIVANLPA